MIVASVEGDPDQRPKTAVLFGNKSFRSKGPSIFIVRAACFWRQEYDFSCRVASAGEPSNLVSGQPRGGQKGLADRASQFRCLVGDRFGRGFISAAPTRVHSSVEPLPVYTGDLISGQDQVTGQRRPDRPGADYCVPVRQSRRRLCAPD